ncbi:MAG: ABC transporter substrate-binding protein [Bacillota bacterium]
MADNPKLSWKLLLGIMLVITTITGSLVFYLKWQKVDKFKFDPTVELDLTEEYEITYWDYPLFVGQDESYEEFLKQVIAEFNEMYPNVEVNYQLLSFKEGREKLQKSITAGQPPDIYHAIFGNQLFSRKLQIPVDLYLNQGQESKLTNYNEISIKAFSYQDKLWGLPNWIYPQVWVGNQQLLEEVDFEREKLETSWNQQDFLQLAQDLSKLGQDNGIIFNPYNPELYYQLLTANQQQRLVSSNYELNFTAAELTKLFKFLDQLRQREVFSSSPTKMLQDLLPYFWQNKAGIIAPANMWLLNHFYLRSKQEEKVKPTLLPIPTWKSEIKQSPIKVMGLLLFRQQEYQGDQHTKAAYKFAEFMNQQKSLFIAKKLKVVPTYLPLESLWYQEVQLSSTVKQELKSYINQGRVYQLSNVKAAKLENKIKDIVYQRALKFWQDKESINSIVKLIMSDSQRVIDNEKNSEKDSPGN